MGSSGKRITPRGAASEPDIPQSSRSSRKSAATEGPIRVVVADGHPLVRKRICGLLGKHKGIQVLGDAADSQQALELVRRLHPDVLVTSIETPYPNEVEAIKRIRALGVGTRIVVLSGYPDQALVRRALKNGASGYVLKCCLPEELLCALRAAQRGNTYLSPEIAEWVISKDATAEYHTLQQLTSREHEVLQLVVRGETNRSIARKLGISEKTVEKHRSSMMAKLEVHNIADLICTAIKNGLVSV